MVEYNSLDEQLKAEGFVAETILDNERMANRLADVALDIARGKYVDYRMVPVDVALKGSGHEPIKALHVLYVKESEAYKKELVGTVRMLFVECKEGEHIQL